MTDTVKTLAVSTRPELPQVPCSCCGGTGRDAFYDPFAEPGEDPGPCPECQGKGTLNGALAIDSVVTDPIFGPNPYRPRVSVYGRTITICAGAVQTQIDVEPTGELSIQTYECHCRPGAEEPDYETLVHGIVTMEQLQDALVTACYEEDRHAAQVCPECGRIMTEREVYAIGVCTRCETHRTV